jgi:hypothetical protein
MMQRVTYVRFSKDSNFPLFNKWGGESDVPMKNEEEGSGLNIQRVQF